MGDSEIWTTKLAAWLHDPAEKALVLLRDPLGHEGDTVRKLREQYLGATLNSDIARIVRKADHWASAADRPQFPQDAKHRYPKWAQVDFAADPEIIHPLSGSRINLRQRLTDISPSAIKAISIDHFRTILDELGPDATDRQRQLALWRFGPEPPADEIGALWGLLPADTRVPDHSIWAHLDLVSAFAGAFADDSSGHRVPALLSMSFGPVQGFISSGRTTSDLWAGSHLLSCIAWEGMKVIAEALGPDAVLLPQLRGIPLVDLWLWRSCGLTKSLFQNVEWLKSATDHNPLFTAAVPNRFIALVPADRTHALAEEVTARVRSWVLNEAEEMLRMIFERTDEPMDSQAHCWYQLKEQLSDFPEVNWSSVAWPVGMDKQAEDAEESLREALAVFYPEGTASPGLLGEEVWKVIKRDISIDGTVFFRSNPGTLYAAIFDLAVRSDAALRTTRTFDQLEQCGYRDSLSGEAEWLCSHPDELRLSPGSRQQTIWAKVHRANRSWARKGEHLDARSMLKRLWPNRFSRWVKEIGALQNIPQRYVVSTQTMALASALEALIADLDGKEMSRSQQELLQEIRQEGDLQPVALPRRLALKYRTLNDESRRLVDRLPSLLDAVSEDDSPTSEQRRTRIEKLIKEATRFRTEAYYGLILLDGDRMGAWLAPSPSSGKCQSATESGTGGQAGPTRLKFSQTWRKKVVCGIKNLTDNDQAVRDYLESERPASPARHAAISEALNSYALHLVRHVIEHECKGMVIYAGGDDVLAMVAVDDLPRALELLCDTFRGQRASGASMPANSALDVDCGFVRIKTGASKGRLLRVMGELATASAGAVVAHHTAPLGMVLRTLRDAERDAKNAGRNQFSLRILKRSGSEVRLTAPWERSGSDGKNTPLENLLQLRNHLAEGDLSRRTAYLASAWLHQLPALNNPQKLEHLLTEHLKTVLQDRRGLTESDVEHSRTGTNELAADMASMAVELGMSRVPRIGEPAPVLAWLHDFIAAAEFLARNGRSQPPRSHSK